MTAKNQDFEIYQGDSKNLEFETRDEDGQILDITSATINWSLARVENDGSFSVLVTLTVGDGVVLTDAAAGIFTVSMLPAHTQSLDIDDLYRHEAEITDTSGNVSTVSNGSVDILDDTSPNG